MIRGSPCMQIVPVIAMESDHGLAQLTMRLIVWITRITRYYKEIKINEARTDVGAARTVVVVVPVCSLTVCGCGCSGVAAPCEPRRVSSRLVLDDQVAILPLGSLTGYLHFASSCAVVYG